jgi:transcriptional antiterminator RfaH
MRWICARLELQRERVAKHFLQLAGYAVYIPLIREHVVRRHRRVERIASLFPSYGFVGLTEQQGWYSVRWSIGVAAVLMGGDHPAVVPDAILDDIRRRERNGAIELARNGFKLGDAVCVRAGPFEGQRGLYAGQAPHERVAVLLALLGSQRRVILPRHDVEATPAPP